MLPRTIHSSLLVPTTVLVAGFALAQGKQAPIKPAIASPLEDQVPALRKQSSWAQDTSYSANPDKKNRGVYAVGNGRVFTYLGLGVRANTMQAISGPQYQTGERHAPKGNFGELTMTLEAGGKGVALPDQRIRRVSRANLIVTEDSAAGGLALRTLTFAQPDTQTITRVVEVVNSGKAAAAGILLRTHLEGKLTAIGKNKVLSSYANGKRKSFAVFSISKGEANDGGFVTDIGDLKPGGKWVGILTITTGSGSGPDDGWSATTADMGTAIEAANSSIKWYAKKLEVCPRVESDNLKIRDLIWDWQVNALVLRCAQSGVLVPMINDRGCRIRECTGPILILMRNNMWAEAARMLRFIHDAICVLGELPEYIPLDLDVSSADSKKTDWKKLKVPAGDLASWLILEHFWYFRATRDTKLIEAHLPLLEACLKRQARGKDSMIAFSGHETYLRKHVLDTLREGTEADPLFVSVAPEAGRVPYSLASGTLFLIALQAYGEMLDGIDRVKNPSRYAKETPEKRPGKPYLNRSFDIMSDLEKRFFVEGPERFAPAVSAVTGQVHVEPFANLSLMPIWCGFTFPTGERSRDNLRFSLRALQNGKSTLVGTTRTVRRFTGEVPGMVLTGLIERDARRRHDALAALLKMAEPSGTWGEVYDAAGRPIATNDSKWPNRMRPKESGINFDAFWFALTGVRHVSVPNFDDDSIKVKLRLPVGTKYFNFYNLKKDGRAFNLYCKDEPRQLTQKELDGEKNLPPEDRKKPGTPYRRFHFRMELVSKVPAKGYWQVDANVAGTMFVRYLMPKDPVVEQEFWKEDATEFFPGKQNYSNKPAPPLAKAKKATTLLLTNRKVAAEMWADAKAEVTIVDTGLPISMRQLGALLVDKEGKPVHQTLILDLGYDASDARTHRRTASWQNRAWVNALRAFRSAGGIVVQPKVFSTYHVQGDDGKFKPVLAPGGRLELPNPKAPKVVRLMLDAASECEGVLRIGTGCGYALLVNGDEIISESGARRAIPDQDAELINLKKGPNVIELRLAGDGKQVIYSRISDERGRPLKGVTVK